MFVAFLAGMIAGACAIVSLAFLVLSADIKRLQRGATSARAVAR